MAFTWNTGSLAPPYAYTWTLTVVGDAGTLTYFHHYVSKPASSERFTIDGHRADEFRTAVTTAMKSGCGTGAGNGGGLVGGPYGELMVTAGNASICDAQLGGNVDSAAVLDNLKAAALAIIPVTISDGFGS